MAQDRTRGLHGEPFYERVYALVREVPAGKVTTYGDVGRALGAPHAARATGYALRAAPQGQDIPWWRVVNAAGRISPRGPGLGAEIQRQMLEAEGVSFRLDGSIDLVRFGHSWHQGDGAGPGISGGAA
jgi:methylated-DNA-protein-cysteine methyltransferase-like protein